MRDTDIIEAIWATAPMRHRHSGITIGQRTTANNKEFERHRADIIEFVGAHASETTVREVRSYDIADKAVLMFLEAIDDSMSMRELLEELTDES